MLESKQLFVIPLDEHGEWYRYHHLFADFLQQQLRLNDPEQWEQAHERAASWFEAHGWIEESVEHYLAGRQYSEVIRRAGIGATRYATLCPNHGSRL
ncbi:MAG: hypothetical protein K0Q73_2936 [Paenibacillus sp.]|nr:hypothetical protein [Paenibacillus sp.]